MTIKIKKLKGWRLIIVIKVLIMGVTWIKLYGFVMIGVWMRYQQIMAPNIEGVECFNWVLCSYSR
jgi:hypothetical protein